MPDTGKPVRPGCLRDRAKRPGCGAWRRRSRAGDESPVRLVCPARRETSSGFVAGAASRPSTPQAYSTVRRGWATERNAPDAEPGGVAVERVIKAQFAWFAPLVARRRQVS